MLRRYMALWRCSPFKRRRKSERVSKVTERKRVKVTEQSAPAYSVIASSVTQENN
jgi:hypothetical protein